MKKNQKKTKERHESHHYNSWNSPSTKGQQTHENLINTLDNHPDKVYAKIKINELPDMSLKADTGLEACVITVIESPVLPILDYYPSIQQCSKRIWRLRNRNTGVAIVHISFKDKSTNINFNIAEAPGCHPCWGGDSART